MGGDAESYASFGWLFDQWSVIVISVMASLSPVTHGVIVPASALISAAFTAWLIILVFRVATGGLGQTLVSGALTLLLVLWGIQPATYQTEGRAALHMTHAQLTVMTLGISVQTIFAQSLSSVLADHTVAGKIIPSTKAVEDAVARSAQMFGDSDLARLIVDYNQQCAPSSAVVAQPGHGVELSAYHAVGLLGGGGLGVPAESFSAIAQAAEAGAGFAIWTRIKNVRKAESFLEGLYSLTPLSSIDSVRGSYDMGALRARRDAGMQALKDDGRPFGGTRGYSLPTQNHWLGKFNGDQSAQGEYLPVSAGPADANSVVADKTISRQFSPGTCLEAYQVAQLGAEQAYRALVETGSRVGDPTAVSTDTGLISGGAAWQRMLTRVMNDGNAEASGAKNVLAGALAAFQTIKNTFSWLNLQTLLPMAVGGLAILFAFVVIIAPIFLLTSVLMGVKTLTTWLGMLMICVLMTIFIQIVAVGVSIGMAGISANQAAAASGWQGEGADLDMLRGLLGVAAAVVLAVALWLSTQLTGVALTGLSMAARNAVVAATDAISTAAKIGGGVALSKKLAKNDNGGGGGGRDGKKSDGGGGGGGGGGAPSPPGRDVSVSAAGSSRSSGSTGRASGKFNLNPSAPPRSDAVAKANAQAGFERVRRKLDKVKSGD